MKEQEKVTATEETDTATSNEEKVNKMDSPKETAATETPDDANQQSEASDVKNQQDIPLEEQYEQMQNEIKELKKQLKEKEDRYLRLQADLDNFRRRTKLDAEANKKYRAQNLITDLLPVIDNFERALQTKTNHEEVKSVLAGMEMVYKSLLEALKSEGAEPIDAVGKEFDPNFHQAVMLVNDDSYATNTVVEEMQKGYLLKDRVIRPSMVKVNE